MVRSFQKIRDTQPWLQSGVGDHVQHRVTGRRIFDARLGGRRPSGDPRSRVGAAWRYVGDGGDVRPAELWLLREHGAGAGAGRLFQVRRFQACSSGLSAAGYIETMGIPLMRGRSITRDDLERKEPVAVVDDAFAKRVFPGEDPIGQYVISSAPPPTPGGPPGPVAASDCRRRRQHADTFDGRAGAGVAALHADVDCRWPGHPGPGAGRTRRVADEISWSGRRRLRRRS